MYFWCDPRSFVIALKFDTIYLWKRLWNDSIDFLVVG